MQLNSCYSFQTIPKCSFHYCSSVQSYGGLTDFAYPIIADPKRELAVQLGMLDPAEKDKAGLPLTARAVSPVELWLNLLCYDY